MRTIVFVYIIKEVAQAHAHNAPLEWFSSTPGQVVIPRLLSEICWLCIRELTLVRHTCLDEYLDRLEACRSRV